MYSLSSYLFDIAAHLLCIASYSSVPNHISSALIAVLGLVCSVYELSEKRRQSLPLLTTQSGVLLDIALEGSVSGAPKPTIPEL